LFSHVFHHSSNDEKWLAKMRLTMPTTPKHRQEKIIDILIFHGIHVAS